MASGRLVSNKQSVNLSIISAHQFMNGSEHAIVARRSKQNRHWAVQSRWRADLLAQLAREEERRHQ